MNQNDQAFEVWLERVPTGKRAIRKKIIHDGPLPEGFGLLTQFTLQGEQWCVKKIKPTKIFMRLDAKTLQPVD